MAPANYLILRNAGQQFLESIPIRYPGTGTVLDCLSPLELEVGWLHSQTYVQLQHIFRVPAEHVMVFHHGSILASDIRLTLESYNRLMSLFGLVPQPAGVPKFSPEGLERVANAPPLQGHYDANRKGSIMMLNRV